MACIAEDTSRYELSSRLNGANGDVELTKCDEESISSSLYSVMSFDDLSLKPEFLRAIKVMGFNKPSKIQGMVLPILLQNPPVNIMAQSQSGTGKTAAFLLAALMRVDPSKHYPQVLILLPTFELAKQVAESCRAILKFSNDISVVDVVSGAMLPYGEKIKQHVVIGTPGKMHDWGLKKRHFDIKKLRVFVLDEADCMISYGHHDISIKLHRNLNDAECQMLLFSATFDDEVIEFADVIIKEPFVKITLKKEELSLINIKQIYLKTNGESDKLNALQCIYESFAICQAMVFCATRMSANEITKKLKSLGQSASVLSAELDVVQRRKTIQEFRDGRVRVLVTTNLCSRGIDIQQVSLVINYDLPKNGAEQADCETYLHRVGRTGRFGRHGLAINFVDPSVSSDQMVIDQIQDHYKIEITQKDVTDLVE